MGPRKILFLIFAGQLLLLAALGWHFRHALNPDAVAYLQLAKHYAEGNWGLAVSGYWGSGISWLLALGFKLGMPALVVARIGMALSALIFVWGTAKFYKVVLLPGGWRLGGIAWAAVVSAWWSVQFITPDLLLGGIMLLAVSQMLSPDWSRNPMRAVGAGWWWGVGYLIKPVALPLGGLLVLFFGLRAYGTDRNAIRNIVRSALFTVLLMFLVASPWIMVLSQKYGRLTVSTTPGISHTLTGPTDQDRYHPFARQFHSPEVGRITSWEEPSRMAYHHWSPLENWSYARHQFKVLVQHAGVWLALVTSINLGAFAAFWAWWRSPRRSAARRRLSGMGLLPLALGLIYLPYYFTLTEQRFFYATLPVFFAGLVLMASAKSPTTGLTWRWRKLAVWVCVTIPILAQIGWMGDRTATAGEVAWQLSARMRQANLIGPVAGSANLAGGRTGLYVAFHLQQPWCGDMLSPTPDDIVRSGAKFFLVRRDSVLAELLRNNPLFQSQDARLFGAAPAAAHGPVEVFEIRPRAN